MKDLINELYKLVGDFYNCGLDYSATALENIIKRYDIK